MVVNALVISLLSLGCTSLAQAAKGTVYYDTAYGTGQYCGKHGDVDEGTPESHYIEMINHTGACGYSVADISDNRLVAFDGTLMANQAASYCGKEIQVSITKPDGTVEPFQFSEGPLFIGDGCAACSGGGTIDLSAKALVEINGDCTANPQLTYQVMDTMIGPEYAQLAGASLDAWHSAGNGKGGNGAGAANSSGQNSVVSSAVSTVSAVTQPDSNSATQAISNPVNSVTVPSQTIPTVPVPADPVNPAPTAPTVSAVGAPGVSASQSSSSLLPAGVTTSSVVPPVYTPCTVPGDPASCAGGSGGTGGPAGKPMGLFAESGSSANGSGGNCKRRKRRRLDDSH